MPLSTVKGAYDDFSDWSDDWHEEQGFDPDDPDDVEDSQLDGIPILFEGMGGPARAGAGLLKGGSKLLSRGSKTTKAAKAASAGSKAASTASKAKSSSIMARSASLPGALKKANKSVDLGRRGASALTLGEVPEIPSFDVPDWDIALPDDEDRDDEPDDLPVKAIAAVAAAGLGALVLFGGDSSVSA